MFKSHDKTDIVALVALLNAELGRLDVGISGRAGRQRTDDGAARQMGVVSQMGWNVQRGPGGTVVFTASLQPPCRPRAAGKSPRGTMCGDCVGWIIGSKRTYHDVRLTFCRRLSTPYAQAPEMVRVASLGIAITSHFCLFRNTDVRVHLVGVFRLDAELRI
jgi:hypothetical protein